MVVKVFRHWVDYSIEVRQEVNPATYSPGNKSFHNFLLVAIN